MQNPDCSFIRQLPIITLCVTTLILLSCEFTRPNVSYDGCLAGVDPCPESCNGLDDDEDGLIDEGLSELCAVMTDTVVKRSGINGGFGRSLTTIPDQDGDGYSELLVSSTRALNDLDFNDPQEGEVSLISVSEQTQKVLWTVRSGGDFGFSITAGALGFGSEVQDSADWAWCAGAPTREEQGGVGRVICLDFNGDVVTRYSSNGQFGLGHWLTTRPQLDNTVNLIVTEPTWGELSEENESETDLRGRILELQVGEDQLEVSSSWQGGAQQHIGERVVSVPDVNDDGLPDWLFTGYADNQRQVWLVDGTNDLNASRDLGRIKRFSTTDDTEGLFGESLTAGYWSQDSELPMLAIGAPIVKMMREGQEISVGRVYLTNGEGTPLGTNTAVTSGSGLGLGQALLNVKVGNQEVLIAAGGGLLRIIKIEDLAPKVLQEFTLPLGVTTQLATGNKVEPNGEVRVWIGFPELEEVHLLTLRAPSSNVELNQ